MTIEVHAYRVLALHGLGRFDECLPLAAEASVILREGPAADPRQANQITAVHGAVLRQLGHLDEALAVLEPLELATRRLPANAPSRVEATATLWWLMDRLDEERPGQGWNVKREAEPRPADAP